MKKLSIILLCALALFTIVSCKEEPEPEPVQSSPVLTVKVAEGATFEQSGKIQFKLEQEFNDGESIEFLAKFSSDISLITVRQGGDPNTKFLTDAPISGLEKTADGWCIVSIDANSVSLDDDSFEYLGITLYVADETRANSFISIKDLKLNGVVVDFSKVDAEEYVQAYYGTPNEFDVEIK